MKNFHLNSFEEKLPYKISGKIHKKKNLLSLKITLMGDLGKIIWPSQRSFPQRIDELWKKTCFEIFFAGSKSSRYFEYNMSPQGDWNIFCFDKYRENKIEPSFVPTPSIFPIEKNETKHIYSIRVPLFEDLLFYNRIGVSVVVQTTQGFHFWSLKHLREVPDFHDPKSFSIRLW